MFEEPKEMKEDQAVSQCESQSARDSDGSDSESDHAEASTENADEMQESWDETKTKKCIAINPLSMSGSSDFLKELSATSLHSLSMKANQVSFAQPSLDLGARAPYNFGAVMPPAEPFGAAFNSSLANSLSNFLSKSESEFLFGCAASAMSTDSLMKVPYFLAHSFRSGSLASLPLSVK
ncbi:hypothetical protein GUITHDRAFT_145435 [Guillardia theta CCMP2712]|uniref:Uncharacterized protein n=1 Tax=Guillardia theta (strain CCMP2712) TaxID=905079 RepID=L1ILZ1_GUITC|nr:hypothetical protein GUITHDRAFT_145435 [Guillardia theta CCMP2712]EKX36800.1 hypothetical protein GUITHDRAFT_145435 [Guillardia theta CCMP2712]|eukprot:XP_005823780.1 hypothetical protein GUITHDRAFT_145435 [Guillardia theta CCMP2712]